MSMLGDEYLRGKYRVPAREDESGSSGRERLCAPKPLQWNATTAEAGYRLILERIPAIVYTQALGPAGRCFYISQQLNSILGFSPEEWITDPSLWFNQVHPEDRDRVLAEEYKSARTKQPLRTEYRIFRNDGRMLWVADEAVPVNGLADGSVTLHGTMTDITSRKQFEEALQESSELHEKIISTLDEGLIVYDRELNCVIWNRYMQELTGLPAAEVVGRRPFQLFPFATEHNIQASLRRALAGETVDTDPLKLQMPVKGGTAWIETRHSPLRNHREEIIGVVATVRDITEVKIAERAVSYHMSQQAAVAEFGHRAMVERSTATLMDEAVTLVTKTLEVEHCELLMIFSGQKLMLVAGSGWKEGSIGTTVPGGTNSHAGYTLLAGEPVIVEDLQVESRFRRPQLLSDHGIVSGVTVAIRGQHGDFGVLGAHTDHKRIFTKDECNFLSSVANVLASAIERSQSEQELRASEANFRSLISNAPFGIFRSTADSDQFLSVNRALVEMLGYESEAELLAASLKCDIYAQPEDRDQILNQFQKHEHFHGEVRWRRKDGKTVTVEITGRQVGQGNGCSPSLEGIAKDVSQHHALEAQFRQAQKMEAVGRLAGGVAHDFNNLLSVVNGYSDLLLEAVGTANPLAFKVTEIKRAGERGAALTRQLMAFSRQQVLQPKVLNINATISETNNMLRRLIGEDVELVFKSESSLGNVKADPGQIVQIIMNLAVNARDAMPDGGKLIIETSNIGLDPVYLAKHPGAHTGDYVLMTISDTGTGMNAETLSHIFEPFYTTKEFGHGTGLGLSTVYGIVKQSNGYVAVYSELGFGTTFKIYLPRIYSELQEAAPVGTATILRQHTETVLLVDDDTHMRAMLREFLEGLGYQVMEAKDGPDALELARENKAIHALITDVVMPGMNGRELAEKISTISPGIRIVYLSGYSNTVIAEHGILPQGIVLVEKPFELRKLAESLEQMLSQN